MGVVHCAPCCDSRPTKTTEKAATKRNLWVSHVTTGCTDCFCQQLLAATHDVTVTDVSISTSGTPAHICCLTPARHPHLHATEEYRRPRQLKGSFPIVAYFPLDLPRFSLPLPCIKFAASLAEDLMDQKGVFVIENRCHLYLVSSG